MEGETPCWRTFPTDRSYQNYGRDEQWLCCKGQNTICSKQDLFSSFGRALDQAAPTNDYGKKAHDDLIITRGAGFRKEKNKKKKGSYRGGEITASVIESAY